MRSIRQQSKFQKAPRNSTQTANHNEKKILVIRKCDWTKNIEPHRPDILAEKNSKVMEVDIHYLQKIQTNGNCRKLITNR